LLNSPAEHFGNAVVVFNPKIKVLETETQLIDRDRSLLRVEFSYAGQEYLLYTTHLDYQSELRRKKQVQKIFAFMDKHLQKDSRVIFCGDFNALCRADYSELEIETIQNRRKENRWELAEFEVYEEIVKFGFSDLFREKPIFGSRFNTRIDYFFGINIANFEASSLAGYEHLSDHKNILLTLKNEENA
jgi:endonuclease/exonuclease/phosphatase family metal-dependent hydrolase